MPPPPQKYSKQKNWEHFFQVKDDMQQGILFKAIKLREFFPGKKWYANIAIENNFIYLSIQIIFWYKIKNSFDS